MKKLMAASLLVTVSACTWVNENPNAQSVAIRTDEDVSQCERVGVIHANTKYKFAGIKRSEEKVLSELQALARNEALKLGANTITPDEPVNAGTQSYIAYNCN